LNVQTLYIIDKRSKVLIFLGVLAEGVSINQQELSNVLGTIVSQSMNLNINSFTQAKVNDNSYYFGVFEKLIIILEYKNDIPPEDFVLELEKVFSKKYWDILDNYSNEDIPKFKSFLDDVKEISLKYIGSTKKEEKIEEPEISNEIEPVPPVEKKIGTYPLIEPLKRDAYPEGIPDYSRDEIFWNEAEMLKNEYVADYVEGMITKLQIFLSISLTHHYEIYIDFTNYPSRPELTVGQGLLDELGGNLGDILFFYKNWDTKVPPHIIEIIREFEAVLMKFKVKGKLSDTSEMPEAALPDLEPLPELPPIEEEITEEKTQKEIPSESKDTSSNIIEIIIKTIEKSGFKIEKSEAEIFIKKFQAKYKRLPSKDEIDSIVKGYIKQKEKKK